MQVTANGIQLEVEEHGPRDGVPLVLIRGLGSQLIHWPKEFVQGFADCGYRTIIFDNRDVGKSQRCPADGVDGMPETILRQIETSGKVTAAYRLEDMARDVVGLLDALKIDKAHTFGISMGGGIAQILAIEHADRLLSASIVMTRASFGAQMGIGNLLSYPQDRDGFIKSSLQADHAWGSPGFAPDDHYFIDLAGRAYDRGAEADGVNRQLLAILTSSDRVEALQKVNLPCYVIHGRDDALIPWQAGVEIAELITASDLEVIAGMGHVITPSLSPILVDKVDAFIKRRGLGGA